VTIRFITQYFFATLTVLCFSANSHSDNSGSASPTVHNDAHAIRAIINTTYDTPENKVTINPVVVEGDHAVASWIVAEKGGRVVMFRTPNNKWEIVLCSGKVVKEEKFLKETGIPDISARKLAINLAKEEAKLPAATIALFDSFSAIVRGAHHSRNDSNASEHFKNSDTLHPSNHND